MSPSKRAASVNHSRRNQRLLHTLENKDYSINQLGKILKISPSRICDLLNLKLSPLRADTGEYRTMCHRIAYHFYVETEWLFPLQLYNITQTTRDPKEDVRMLSLNECTDIPSRDNADAGIEQEIFHQTIEEALESLRPRESEIIRMRFGINPERRIYTLREIAHHFDRSVESVRQREENALRKLRLPSRKKILQDRR